MSESVERKKGTPAPKCRLAPPDVSPAHHFVVVSEATTFGRLVILCRQCGALLTTDVG